MKILTHLEIDRELCGEPVRVGAGEAEVVLRCVRSMAADGEGLLHGGFLFGAADYAAMLAVNDPNVVLGAAESRFLAPVRVGQEVALMAHVVSIEGRKRRVEVEARVGDRPVFEGTFTCFVLDQHVLEGSR